MLCYRYFYSTRLVLLTQLYLLLIDSNTSRHPKHSLGQDIDLRNGLLRFDCPGRR
jgi:hypothetical protein